MKVGWRKRQSGQKPGQIRDNTKAVRRKSLLDKSGRRDSNPRHPAWEASALPTELRPHLLRRNSTTRCDGAIACGLRRRRACEFRRARSDRSTMSQALRTQPAKPGAAHAGNPKRGPCRQLSCRPPCPAWRGLRAPAIALPARADRGTVGRPGSRASCSGGCSNGARTSGRQGSRAC